MSGLRCEREGGIVTLILDRPERRNAIDVPLWRALAAALGEIRERESDRVVLLTGAGGSFCAGGDLSGAAPDAPGRSGDPVEAALRAMRESVGAACLALHELPQPVIAAVEGSAAGAGANLAFACDLVVAARDARFGQVFVRRALPVDSGGSWLLPRLVGLQRAKRLALLGDWLPAPEARDLGLVSELVGTGEALPRARELAARLVGSSPRALAWIKRNLNRSCEWSFEQTLEEEARALADCVASPEFAAAMRAFLAKGAG
jgi:2-(1,2-epoxy-1,2-dihydrophenyl)acetyl-CoA isomerase